MGSSSPRWGGDRYRCYTEERGKQVEMIVPRTVFEIRGRVTIIEYSADHLEDKVLRGVLEVLRSGYPFPVQYLSDSGGVKTDSFFCKSYTPPSYLGSENGEPIWHNLSFTLQSEYPTEEE